MFESILCQVTEYDPDVLESLIGLAVEIVREGREGRRVGTLFTLGDEIAVLARSRPLILDPLSGILSLHSISPISIYAERSRNWHSWTAGSWSVAKELSFPRAAISMPWLHKWMCRWDSAAVTLPPRT
jgi:hypothetical protein